MAKWKECPQCMMVMPTGEVKFAIKVAVREYDSDLIKIAMEGMLEE